jgi:hypothetical protein
VRSVAVARPLYWLARYSKSSVLFELRCICGPNRDGVSGGWIRLHNKELYPSLNINGKATLLIWAGPVAYLGMTRYTKDFRGES